MKDPTEEELAGAAEKLDTMVAQLQLCPDFFFSPASFGPLPELWLQAKLTIELQPFQDKMARILYAIAVELWLRKGEADIQRTLDGAASRPSFLFQRGSAGSYQNVQKVYIQSVRSTPPPQSDEASGETAGARTDGNLLAVRFADNRAPGTTWDIDTEYAQRNSFSATIEGYSNNLIQPAVMLSFVPMGATRVVLEIITPSENGITAERWRKDAAVCPSNWPTDYSLLRA
ncbi:unnamed protein product, partial [Cladocopium goreaui]